MILKTLIGLSIFLIGCTGHQNTSEDEPKPYSGLLIENGINRGIRYKNLKGTDRIITYIPVTITNDGENRIDLKIEFSSEYEYPNPESQEKFKLVILPRGIYYLQIKSSGLSHHQKIVLQ